MTMNQQPDQQLRKRGKYTQTLTTFEHQEYRVNVYKLDKMSVHIKK